MTRKHNQGGFIKGTPAVLVSVLLVAQTALLYSFSRTEEIPTHVPLAELGPSAGTWRQTSDRPLDQETQDVLKADDVVDRNYISLSHPYPANLFVAFFKSQRTGVAPHSPKNCLPGSGWTAVLSETIHVDVPGRPKPVEANRYIVQRGEAKSLVLYWYQSRDRTVASEYKAKFFVALDAMRYNRTDTALVRVIVPLGAGDPEPGLKAAIDFVRAMYGPLRKHFPA